MFNPDEKISSKGIVKITNPFDIEIVLVSDYSLFDLKKVPLYDAIVMDYTDSIGCLETLREIRGANIESIYLIPVFVLSMAEIKNPELGELADGFIQSIQPESIYTFSEATKSKRKQLKPYTVNPDINRNLIKLLRYSFTRNKTIKPVKDRTSIIGYKYPILALNLGANAAKVEIQSLNEALEKEFFHGTFVDRSHLCGNCHSVFLNYKEVDPENGSANLVTESLIHHFSCAYIGPQSDFVRSDHLVCPKCNKTLRHIGIDYDKPSVMYRNVDTDNYFQEPEMVAECMNCGSKNEIEGLVQYDVYELELSDKGIQEAIQPKGTQSNKEVVYSGFITYSTFTTFMKFEIERVKSSNRNSNIGLIRLNISSTVEAQLGVRYDKLIEEISEFLTHNTDSSCILSRSIHSFFILFPDVPLLNSKTKLNDLTSAVRTLLENNVKDLNIEVISNIKELTESSEYQSVLNELRASILSE